MQPGNFYTGGTLDRAGNRRKDERFTAGLLTDPATRFAPSHAGRPLVRPAERGAWQPVLPRLADHPELAASLEHRSWALLGLDADGAAHLAIDLGEQDDPVPPGLETADARFEELRRVATRIDGADAALLAQARGLLNWRRAVRFCAICGAPCTPVEAGWVMRCAACGQSHFPRTDPAVIMLVTHGERALLARNARYQGTRMFSTLAGFLEPGESLEEAVAREVFEECGIRATRIRYHSSQPWPFPGSVMLGFVAETDADAITIDDDEIVEARFYTRDDLRNCASIGFELPPRTSIARRMIDDWISEE